MTFPQASAQQTENPVFEASSHVMDAAEAVTVNEDAIDAFAQDVDPAEFELPLWDAPVFPNPSETPLPEQFLFMLVGMSLNYCFNDVRGSAEKYRTEWLGGDWEGAFGMWAALKRATETGGGPDILSPEALATLTVEDVEELFAPAEGTALPLPDERTAALNEIGSTIQQEFDGDIEAFYSTFVPGQSVSAQSMTEMAVEMFDCFADTSEYDGREVPFNKRAQLLPLMLAGYWQKGPVSVTGTEWLTLPADYGVPATLRGFELITVTDDALDAQIAAMEEVPEGSPQEIELRAATVVAGALLVDALSTHHDTTRGTPEVDYYLWSRRNESEIPTHRTLTTAY